MAETFTEHGLIHILNTSLRQQTQTATWYAGLFVSATPSTVPASTASGSGTGWTEMSASTGTYARVAITGSLLAAPYVIGSSSVGTSAAGASASFTGFTSASPANGIFLATGSAPGAAAGSPIWFANFDSAASRAFSTTSDTLTAAITIKALP